MLDSKQNILNVKAPSYAKSEYFIYNYVHFMYTTDSI